MLLSAKEILQIHQHEFLKRLSEHLNDEQISESQIVAWRKTYKIFRNILETNLSLQDCFFLFEYPIPFTDGKRPDVLMFLRNIIYIIEFKNRVCYNKDDLDQLISYKTLITIKRRV